jgi:single-strand DNA-binding protein
MVSFNKVILAGNLTRDPELKYIPSGAAVCDFTIAVNRKWKSKEGEAKEEVGFFDCQAWGRTGELIAEYCKKGSPLLVEGYLKHERWEDQSGNQRSRIRINVMGMQFLGGKKDAGGPPVHADDVPADDNTPF